MIVQAVIFRFTKYIKVFKMALSVNNLEGNEIADDYTRKAADGGRWAATWEILKSNFGKLVLINIFVLITFLPGVAVMIVRNMWVNALGLEYPFNSNTGVGYPVYPQMQGLTESIYLSADILFYSILIVCGFIASIGIAGGAYSIKKLLNTQGEFTVKGFFHGVKVGYLNTVIPVTVFMLFFFATVLVGDWVDLIKATGGKTAGPITAYVFIIIATVLVGIYCAWMIAVGISYRLKFTQIIKNSFVLIIGTPLQTIFFAAFSLISVWVTWICLATGITFLFALALILFILLGFSLTLLIWMSFTQWVFDLYVTPNMKAAKEDADSKKTPKQLAEEKEDEDKRIARELLAAGRSELIARPILPIEDSSAPATLGKTYTRADIARVDADREKLKKDVADYEKKHMSDPVYVEYNRLFAEREKALKVDDKKGKKKKVSSENLLK
jgi:hypothetical protein